MRIDKDVFIIALAEKQMSQREFCRQYGIDHKTINRAFEKDCSSKTLGKIAHALGCNVVDIIREKDINEYQSEMS